MASIQAEKGMQEDNQIFLFWYTIKMYCIHDVDVQFSRCSVDVENTTQEVI